MKNLEALERYLTAQALRSSATVTGSGPTVRPFVTISRQAGAGGHALAETLLGVFADQDDAAFAGWQVFDRELCEMVVADPTYAKFRASLLSEEYRPKADDFVHQILRATVDQDLVMHEVFRVIAAVASAGKAIILGRAGAEVTRDIHPGVAVRLVAPETLRIEGVMDYYGLEEKAARKECAKLDASRARLLKTHFGVDIDDPIRYDLVCNTGQVQLEVIAESITTVLRHRIAAEQSRVVQ